MFHIAIRCAVDLLKKYGMDAIQNIMNLTDRGAQVIHSLDARNMAVKDRSVPLFAFGRSCFDVVAFNFPHAGFFGKEDDPKVIRSFSCSHLLILCDYIEIIVYLLRSP